VSTLPALLVLLHHNSGRIRRVIRRRLFPIAAGISLLACVFCVWAASSCWYFYAHGAILTVNGSEQVVHEPHEVDSARRYAIAAILLAIPPIIRLTQKIKQARDAAVRESRSGRGSCPNCDYSVTGNASGVCPECGRPVAQKAGDTA
jgi:hypothetical protein